MDPHRVAQRTLESLQRIAAAGSHLHSRLRRAGACLFCHGRTRSRCRSFSSYDNWVSGVRCTGKRTDDGRDANILDRGGGRDRADGKADFSSKRSGLKLVYFWKPISLSFVLPSARLPLLV